MHQGQSDLVVARQLIGGAEHGAPKHFVGAFVLFEFELGGQFVGGGHRTGQFENAIFAAGVGGEVAGVGGREDQPQRLTEQFFLVAQRQREAVVEKRRFVVLLPVVVERAGQAGDLLGDGGVGVALRKFREGRGILHFLGDVAAAVVEAEPVGLASGRGQVVVLIEGRKRIIAQRTGYVEGKLFGEVLGGDVDVSAGEVARKIWRKGLVNQYVIDQIGRKQVHLHGVPVGIQPGYFRGVEGRFAVAIAEAAHVHVLAAFDGHAGDPTHGRGHVTVAAFGDLCRGDTVEHDRRLALNGQQGRFGVLN